MISPDDSVNAVGFVAFDFETTGLDASRDSIIEIGAVKFTTSCVIEEFQSFLKTKDGRSVPADATRVHGITDDMLSREPHMEEVFPNFFGFLKDAVLVAHNIAFDFGFLNANLQLCNLPVIENALLVDTLQVVTNVEAESGLKSRKLEDLVRYYNLDINTSHRALSDAHASRLVLLKCIDKISMLGDLSLSEILL